MIFRRTMFGFFARRGGPWRLTLDQPLQHDVIENAHEKVDIL